MSSFPPQLSEKLTQRLARVKHEHDPDLVDRIARGAFEGDPLADRLVATFKELPGGAGWRMLDEALLHGPERVKGAPPELAELLSPALEPPEWVDLDLVDAGALAYWRSGGLNLGLALICGSLAYGYKSARLTRPLAATGRLEKMAPRRIQETSRWVAVATKPGALRPGREGTRATVRLRLVHALVRQHLAADPDWDMPEWGMPISASDTLVTGIGGFMTIPIQALRDLGVRFSPAELEAMTHQWTWIASLMGTPDYLIPRSYREARTTMAAAIALDDEPTEDSPKLMRALLYNGVEFPLEERLPRLLKPPMRSLKARYLGGFARRWMDDEMADRLGVPRTRLAQLALLFLRPMTLAREVARASHLLGSDERIARMELAFVERVSAARFGSVETIDPQEAAREPVLSTS
jgi:mpaB/rubber oxygenase-like protein